jgi:uncharacterized protein YjeT (DUF2065 family)
MAKADIRASAKDTVALAPRCSGIAERWHLSKAYKASADKAFLAFLVFLSGGGRIMAHLLAWGFVIVLEPLHVHIIPRSKQRLFTLQHYENAARIRPFSRPSLMCRELLAVRLL